MTFMQLKNTGFRCNILLINSQRTKYENYKLQFGAVNKLYGRGRNSVQAETGLIFLHHSCKIVLRQAEQIVILLLVDVVLSLAQCRVLTQRAETCAVSLSRKGEPKPSSLKLGRTVQSGMPLSSSILPPERWDKRQASPSLADPNRLGVLVGIESKTSCILFLPGVKVSGLFLMFSMFVTLKTQLQRIMVSSHNSLLTELVVFTPVT